MCGGCLHCDQSMFTSHPEYFRINAKSAHVNQCRLQQTSFAGQDDPETHDVPCCGCADISCFSAFLAMEVVHYILGLIACIFFPDVVASSVLLRGMRDSHALHFVIRGVLGPCLAMILMYVLTLKIATFGQPDWRKIGSWRLLPMILLYSSLLVLSAIRILKDGGVDGWRESSEIEHVAGQAIFLVAYSAFACAASEPNTP